MRKKNGKSNFSYLSATTQKKIRDHKTISRIKKLRIPPAWKNVWINEKNDAKLQATGFDLRGRKQYLYNPNFRKKQDSLKYYHLATFAKALPRIRKKVVTDLNKKEMGITKVVAAIVRIMEKSLIRIGNDEYAKSNHSYGLTTFKASHVKTIGSKIVFKFLGKSKKRHCVELIDSKLAAIIKKCKSLKGRELFSYIGSDGEVHDIKSSHVNRYLKNISGKNISAKDFRTWVATVLAIKFLNLHSKPDSLKAAKKILNNVIKEVAEKLGNTSTICKKSYIYPEVMKQYLKLEATTKSTLKSSNRHRAEKSAEKFLEGSRK